MKIKEISVGALDQELITPKEAASLLRLSLSWLAKARMSGEGPQFMQFGRSVRYSKEALIRWMKSRQRISTRN
jgi:excisionase family DNA binding protein